MTNHQYVEFLNHKRSQIDIAKSVVRRDDKIWLLLGTVKEGYEPIVFRDAEFKVTNAAYASFPVLRVTAYGASPYARFYNRRLSTPEEWLHVFGSEQESKETTRQMESGVTEQVDMEKMHEMMGQSQKEANAQTANAQTNQITPVSSYKANKYEIRVVPKGFGEWSVYGMASDSKEGSGESRYVLMPSGVSRQPWEGFKEVGFRSAQSVRKGQNKTD